MILFCASAVPVFSEAAIRTTNTNRRITFAFPGNLVILLRPKRLLRDVEICFLDPFSCLVEDLGVRLYRRVIPMRVRLAAMREPELVCVVNLKLIQKIELLRFRARIGYVDQRDALLPDPEQATAAQADEVIVGTVEAGPEREANFFQPLLRSGLRLVLRSSRFFILF